MADWVERPGGERYAILDPVADSWFDQARAAEEVKDWHTAIELVKARAECYSVDHHAHSNHLWHMDLLVSAERHTELAELALSDAHARRRLNRSLRDLGMDTELRRRAETGDRDALYCLVRLLSETDRFEQARRAVADIAPDSAYAQQILAG